MRINRSEKIAGQPIKEVRDLVRKLRDYDAVSVELIARSCGKAGISTAAARALIPEMIARGWLKQSGTGRYEEGPEAGRLAAASLLAPISRARADKIVANLIKRVEAINADPGLICWVDRVHVFGSYLTDAAELGDVDVAVALQRRLPGKEWVDESKRRAGASGKHFSNYIEELTYGEAEVSRRVKNRDPYLQICADHVFEELKREGIESRIIYERRP